MHPVKWFTDSKCPSGADADRIFFSGYGIRLKRRLYFALVRLCLCLAIP
jgi:hypothetical protein